MALSRRYAACLYQVGYYLRRAVRGIDAHEVEATSILHSAVRETEELVTAAVGRTGIPGERMYWAELTRIEYITIQTYGFDTSVRIEVWDSAPNPPVLSEETGSPIQRGCYPAPRGKVVWSELPILPSDVHRVILHSQRPSNLFRMTMTFSAAYGMAWRNCKPITGGIHD